MGVLLLLSIGLVIAVLATTGWTAWMLTHPPRRTYAAALARARPGEPAELPPLPTGPRAFRTWSLRFGKLDLPVWDIDGDLTEPTAPTFVLTHGWGDSRIGALWRAQSLFPMAARFVMWDMPGHGEVPGTCTLGAREHLALRALLEQLGSDRPLVLFGWSLGAGVSIAAASNPSVTPIAAIIAEAPYRMPITPARAVLAQQGLPHRVNLPFALALLGFGWLASPRRVFDRSALARNLPCPLLILHGELDIVCPLEDARAIAAAAPAATLVTIPNAAHHGLWTDDASRAACAAAVRTLLSSLDATRTFSSSPAHNPSAV